MIGYNKVLDKLAVLWTPIYRYCQFLEKKRIHIAGKLRSQEDCRFIPLIFSIFLDKIALAFWVIIFYKANIP